MNAGRRAALKKLARISVISLSLLVVSILALRAVYALTLFNAMDGAAHSSGWRSADSISAVNVNEEMTFEASYIFFKIGAVKFQVVGKIDYDSTSAYHLRAYVDSYSGIPFVHFHAVYDTYADAKTLFCLFISRIQKERDNRVYTTTTFDFNRKNIDWDQSLDGKPIMERSLPLDTNYTNGVSFVYYLRKACRDAQGKQMQLNVPMIDDTVQSSVSLTINEKREPCDVPAFNLPLDAERLSGHINFIGTFGISGDFDGWITADSSAVPLKADVKVLLGSVVVRLRDIKGNDWTPPRSAGSE
ncbi:MAG: DUF3108 domain-containing protein [Candidatus Kryptoniota bacterium]